MPAIDPRTTMRTLLATMTAENIKEENGSTNASVESSFHQPLNTIYMTLTDKAVDVLITVSVAGEDPTETGGKDYRLRLVFHAINKGTTPSYTLVAKNVIWQARAEAVRVIDAEEAWTTGTGRDLSRYYGTQLIEMYELYAHITIHEEAPTAYDYRYVEKLKQLEIGKSDVSKTTLEVLNAARADIHLAKNPWISLPIPRGAGDVKQHVLNPVAEVTIYFDELNTFYDFSYATEVSGTNKAVEVGEHYPVGWLKLVYTTVTIDNATGEQTVGSDYAYQFADSSAGTPYYAYVGDVRFHGNSTEKTYWSVQVFATQVTPDAGGGEVANIPQEGDYTSWTETLDVKASEDDDSTLHVSSFFNTDETYVYAVVSIAGVDPRLVIVKVSDLSFSVKDGEAAANFDDMSFVGSSVYGKYFCCIDENLEYLRVYGDTTKLEEIQRDVAADDFRGCVMSGSGKYIFVLYNDDSQDPGDECRFRLYTGS